MKLSEQFEFQFEDVIR